MRRSEVADFEQLEPMKIRLQRLGKTIQYTLHEARIQMERLWQQLPLFYPE